MVKLLTHTFKVTLYESGKFCWKNARWEMKDSISLVDVIAIPLVVYLLFALN